RDERDLAGVALARADERNGPNKVITGACRNAAQRHGKGFWISAAVGTMSGIGAVIWIVYQENVEILPAGWIAPGYFNPDGICRVAGFVVLRNIDSQSKVFAG